MCEMPLLIACVRTMCDDAVEQDGILSYIVIKRFSIET